ncbi:uncharacterized protein METZ01_LOCUS362902 [marine metagenome]|uniref:Cell wall hydrolase SleB domain-containing protein n=1 Tax=marine metagenome TaxID=408172 RepID=A0A382SLH4_9ZZZZ
MKYAVFGILVAFVVFGYISSNALIENETVYIVKDIDPIPEPEIDINQMHCLATNIYHEARGESFAGKVAVGNVTLNRVNHIKYPDTICDVVYQARLRENWRGDMVPVRHKCQFSWYCDGMSDDIVLRTDQGIVIKDHMFAWEQSLEIAGKIIQGEVLDITDGATHYFNSDLADPYWANELVRVVEIDNHSFHKESKIH